MNDQPNPTRAALQRLQVSFGTRQLAWDDAVRAETDKSTRRLAATRRSTWALARQLVEEELAKLSED